MDRARVIDIHAHCEIPVHDIVTGTPLELAGVADDVLDLPARLQQMDARGTDIQALSSMGTGGTRPTAIWPPALSSSRTPGWLNLSAGPRDGWWRLRRCRCSIRISQRNS